MSMATNAGDLARFMAKVEVTDSCWLWKGARRTASGYGSFGLWGKVRTAHRSSLALMRGIAIDAPGVVMHSCDNTSCVNPDHLSIGTQKENLRGMLERGRGCTGERNYHAKLTRPLVNAMRCLNYTGGYSQPELARMFTVHRANVGYILRGDTWK